RRHREQPRLLQRLQHPQLPPPQHQQQPLRQHQQQRRLHRRLQPQLHQVQPHRRLQLQLHQPQRPQLQAQPPQRHQQQRLQPQLQQQHRRHQLQLQRRQHPQPQLLQLQQHQHRRHREQPRLLQRLQHPQLPPPQHQQQPPRQHQQQLLKQPQRQLHLVEGGRRHIKNLKVGDKIWSINDHSYELIEDEIVLMMHNEPNEKVMFYTFQSVEGGQFCLTGSHNIPVFDTIRNKVTMKRADSVTMQDRLIMFGKTVEISNISLTISQGFYAPLTLTGYLMVNNVSTSIFSSNYKASSATLQLVFLPIRIYYHITRWIYGDKYNPFVEIQEGLHPISHFYKEQQAKIRFLLKLPKPFFSTIIIVFILYFIQKLT
ncbi:unnamed protein product, partial [Adineta steineri]